jgi:mutator protein MutT
MDDKYRSLVAAYVMVVNDKNEILLSQRQNTGYRDGFYDMPAGHLEANETLTQAACRELKEETNLDAKPEDMEFLQLLHRQSLNDREYLDVFFKITKWNGEPKLMEPDKCSDMRWFPMDALPDNMVPHQRVVLDSLKSGIRYQEMWGKSPDA